MASGNRVITYVGPKNLKIETFDYPKLIDPQGKKAPHGAILKLVTTNICGSDQHIYRGRFPVPKGTVLGHEMTGEVVELGADVHFIKMGDLCSVPFNVSCGRCRNCKSQHTDTCMNVNDEANAGAYGFNLGGWQGGQSDYLMVPFADWNLLKFPDKDQAMEKIRDLTLLSDILPTGFHGCVQAGVKQGATVYIAGAGPVGRCAAASAHLLGASCIIVGDSNAERLQLVKDAGYETVNIASQTPVADQIEAILGERMVDCGVDAVGFEAHGNGPGAGEEPGVVLNTLMEIVRENGAIGAPGVYAEGDPKAVDADTKAGTYSLDFGKAWIKSPHISAGQAPVMKYNRDLMMAILWDRMPYLGKLAHVEVIPLEKAIDAYAVFNDGSPKKFVIDPHGSLKAAA